MLLFREQRDWIDLKVGACGFVVQWQEYMGSGLTLKPWSSLELELLQEESPK
jgi:hypothetical protein